MPSSGTDEELRPLFSAGLDLPQNPLEFNTQTRNNFNDGKQNKCLIVALFVTCVVVAVLFLLNLFILIRFCLRHKIVWPHPSNSFLGEYATSAVATDNEICSEIGRNAMLEGGNAVDAAIAALFCIGIIDTQSSGLGGGHFMTIYNGTTKSCQVVDAREVAPLSSTENMYKAHFKKARYGWKAIAVPGELHGLWTEYTNFGGGVQWQTLVRPTIKLLKEGYPVSQELAKSLKHHENDILNNSVLRKHFINPETETIFEVGEQIKTRMNLAKTLEMIAESDDPIKLFYHGQIADAMIDEFNLNGGIITKLDLSEYKSIIRRDSEIIYTNLTNGRRICGPPPPSGSSVTQSIIKIMDISYASLKSNGIADFNAEVEFHHKFIEASKFAYAARSRLGDMDFIQDALELSHNITSDWWAEEIRSKITKNAQPDSYYGGDFHSDLPDDHGTTHISVIDKWGNAVSVTSTINLILGSSVLSESTGILFNDQMDDFSLPGHSNSFGYPPSPSNFIRPRKRPMSSMSPIIIYHEHDMDELMPIGGSGGSTIISAVAGATIQALFQDTNLKQAIDYPRLHNQLKPNITSYERSWPKEYIDALKERGHIFEEKQSIAIVTACKVVNGSIFANSDYRKGVESEPAGFR